MWLWHIHLWRRLCYYGLKNIAKTNCCHNDLVALWIHDHLKMWEWLWIVSQTLKAKVLCTQDHFSLKMQGYEQQGETIVLSYIKICDESYSFIIRNKVWLVHKCSSVFQYNFGLEVFLGTQALPRNRGAYVDTQNWHTSGLLDNLGRPVRPVIETGQIGQDKFVIL